MNDFSQHRRHAGRRVRVRGRRGDEPIPPVDALTWEADVDEELEGLPIAVGSPSRPVDLLLGWIAVETLVAAGADVTDDLDLGDTQDTREAQLAGLVDLYWETTGTGWLGAAAGDRAQ